jgi:hypothetical protein
VQYWTLEGNRPSVALVEPEKVAVVAGPEGHTCCFLWQDAHFELPLLDWWLLSKLPEGPCGRRELARVLGYPVDRLVVALTPPMQGYCYKAVVGVLPRR